jgi:hypothetical protein
MNAFETEINFTKNVKVHFKKICNNAIKDSIMIKGAVMMKRTRNLIHSSLVEKEDIDYIMKKKFENFIGVKFVKEFHIKKDENGEIIKEEDSEKPVVDVIEIMKFNKVKPKIIIFALEEIYEKVATNTKIIEDVDKFFLNKMREKESSEKFIKEIVSLTSAKLSKVIDTQAKRNFNIKTSSFGFYTEPPMGNNEFLFKMVNKDILELCEYKK